MSPVVMLVSTWLKAFTPPDAAIAKYVGGAFATATRGWVRLSRLAVADRGLTST
jgi:hypothetical protein